MLTARSQIRTVALIVLATFAVLWLLPPEHLHPALAGRSGVVHRHAMKTIAPQAASSIDHDDHSGHHDHSDHDNHSDDDHSDAQILKTVFASTPGFAPASLIVLHTTAVLSPIWCLVGHLDLLYEWPCHDPPERPTSLRAPPV